MSLSPSPSEGASTDNDKERRIIQSETKKLHKHLRSSVVPFDLAGIDIWHCPMFFIQISPSSRVKCKMPLCLKKLKRGYYRVTLDQAMSRNYGAGGMYPALVALYSVRANVREIITISPVSRKLPTSPSQVFTIVS